MPASEVEAPGAVTASVDSTTATTATISWTGGSGATAFNVFRSGSNGVKGSEVASEVTSPWQDTGLTAETSYWYTVEAENGAGTTDSNQVQATTQAAGGQTILFESTWEDGGVGNSTTNITDNGLWQLNATDGGCTVSTVDLRVVAPGSAPGSWPHGGNILTARNSTAGCGGVEAFQVFDAPAPGDLWGCRYYYCQDADQVFTHNHGPGDLNAVDAIDVVFHELQAAGSGSFNHSLRLGRQADNTSGTAAGDDGGRNFNFRARIAPGSTTNMVFDANTWYRFEWILEWVSVSGSYPTWTYRFYPRVYNMAGDLLADLTYYRHNDGGYFLDQFYAAGSTFLRRNSSGEENHMRSPFFGIAQAKAASTGRLYWAAPVFYLPSSTSDFLGGI